MQIWQIAILDFRWNIENTRKSEIYYFGEKLFLVAKQLKFGKFFGQQSATIPYQLQIWVTTFSSKGGRCIGGKPQFNGIFE